MSLGSAGFTVLSIYGFVGLGDDGAQGTVDPSRVAAQIVTGIGFLGRGRDHQVRHVRPRA